MAAAISPSQGRRTVLIIGCSDGDLGSALAAEFYKDPSIRVFAAARNPTELARLATFGIKTLTLDVLDSSSVTTCVAEVLRLTNGRLDVLVNNAGAGYSMPLMDISVPAAQSRFNLHVWPYISASQVFLPLLHASTACHERHQPRTMYYTSVVSTIPSAHFGVYHASKAASAMLSDTLRLKLKPFGIRVVEIESGGVQSSFFDKLTSDPSATPKLPEGLIYAPARAKTEDVMRAENVSERW